MPLISVIIPAYNAEKTIQDTVQSVLNQTYSDIEIIVINDGSTDKTLECLSSISDARLNVFSYSNSGANPSRNRGLTHAAGDYVSFLDADDLWTPDKLDAQLNALKNHPTAAVAYSWTNFIDESGKVLHSGSYVSASGNVLAELAVVNFLENGSNPLIKKQAVLDVGGFDESLQACQDWDLWLRLAAKYEFVAVSSPQILYRVSTHSVSSNVSKLETACLTVINRTFDQAPDSIQYLKRYSLGNVYKYLAFKSLQNRLSRADSLRNIRLIWHVVQYDPIMLKTKIIWKLLITLGLVTLLPEKIAQLILKRYKLLTDFNSLLVHIRTKVAFSDFKQ
jgi:glycosyltransferase involved in cell wall biosynthesis